MSDALLSHERKLFHKRIIETNTLTLSKENTPSNADSSSASSRAIALKTAEIISRKCRQKINTMNKISGQTLGRQFEILITEFLRNTFLKLDKIRPGKWVIQRSGAGFQMSDFAQYEHLSVLNALMNENRQLAAVLGNEYIISPDVVIYRELCEDSEINSNENIVNNAAAHLADLRNGKNKRPILHASVSAKFTIRSDRAQNSRTEALNLIRNRKGHLPHIVVVTAEPMPGRLASLAFGTGDIDCVYHFALYELIEAVKDCGSDDSVELLDTLINGRRLKDISDLPLDLAI